MGIRIALAGNPNCGKTTMFNALTGANQYVGNWPGVTVEKKEGRIRDKRNGEVIVTDLPGIYSLSPYTLEEVVSRDYIIKENPDVIIDLVDATNIERNLYLTTQLIETGTPVVIALNMSDLLEKRGLKIDASRLSMLLGCPVVETSALKKTGLDELISVAAKTAGKKDIKKPQEIFSKEVESAISSVEADLVHIPEAKRRWYAVKVLENDQKVIDEIGSNAPAAAKAASSRGEIEKLHDDTMESIITDGRYKLSINLLDTDELYDTATDPSEVRNLIDDPEYSEIRNKLHDILLDHMDETRDLYRGYQWAVRPWRKDRKPSWNNSGCTRQRENEEYEPRQWDYDTGLPMKEAVRGKKLYDDKK